MKIKKLISSFWISICFLTFISTLSAQQSEWGKWEKWGAQSDGTYLNPIIPSDYSDIDCIRVGDDYYAISSTFQFSPGMTLLHSKDLVNWEICGNIIDDLTQIGPNLNWSHMNRYNRGIWAGTLRFHDKRFYLFFGTPDEGYFMTSSPTPQGPWAPLTCLLSEAGWDDCCVMWDDNGEACFVAAKAGAGDGLHVASQRAGGVDEVVDGLILLLDVLEVVDMPAEIEVDAIFFEQGFHTGLHVGALAV